MAKIGRLQVFGLKRESSRGTAETVNRAISVESVNFKEVIAKVEDTGSTGTISDIADIDKTKAHAEITANGILRSDDAHDIFYAALGAIATVDNGDDTYTHTLTLANNNTHQSYTIFGDDTVDAKKANGCMIDTLSITAETEQQVKFDMSWLGRSVTGGATETPTYDIADNIKFVSSQIAVRIADEVDDLAAATPICMRSININIAKNVLADDCINSLSPIEIYNQDFNLAGDFTQTYKNNTAKNVYNDNETKAMRVTMTGTEIATGVNAEIEITLAKVKFGERDYDAGNSDIATQTVGFRRVLGDITVKVTNLIGS